MGNKTTLVILTALLFFTIPAISYATTTEPSYVNIGLIGSYGIDSAATNANTNQKPALLGGELEIGSKNIPVSCKVQLGNAQVGTNLSASYYTASYLNVFVQYNFDKLGIPYPLYPYFGLGYSSISITPATPYNEVALGWLIGVNYSISPTFTVGGFYTGFNPTNAGFVYNHFIGVDINYKFNL